MTTRTHKEHLRRRARLWQAGALVAGAGAVALLAAPIGRLLGPPAGEITVDPTIGPGGEGVNSGGGIGAEIDSSLLARLLNGVNPVAPISDADRTPITPVAAVDPATTAPEPTPEPVATGVWSFIGTAFTGRGRHAVVSSNGKQSIVREGATLDGIKLVGIAADHITIERSGVSERIDRAAISTAWAQTPPRAAGGITGGPGRPYVLGQSGQPGSLGQAIPLPVNGRVPGQGAQPPDRDRMLAEISERIISMDAQQRMSLTKELMNPDISSDQRRELLMRFGADPGMDAEQQIQVYKELGIDVEQSPAILKQLEEEAQKR